MDEKHFWIGFTFVKGIGAVRFKKLLDYFGTAKTAWEASPADLVEAGLSATLADRVAAIRQKVELEKIWQNIENQGIQVLTWDDEDFPQRLREISQPPPVLYLRGEFLPEDHFAVAIVGTRRVTSYGRQVTEEIATSLAAGGITIVSGLARGVDSIAHQAALKAGGRTLAVLGSGVDKIYPPEHRTLATQITGRGAVISDYAPGTPPESSNFPPRNRIISGLSMAVLVVEAGRTSGALITAEFAAEQGREVFAVPGNILAPQSKGTNKLIQQGAHPLLSTQDILQALNLTRVSQQKKARKTLPADEIEAALLKALDLEPQHIDEIRNRTGLPVEKVSSTLVMMELKGMVRQVGNMQYVAIREVQSGYSVNEE
jgi:DNA processing protein